jgi:hypothetical protein
MIRRALVSLVTSSLSAFALAGCLGLTPTGGYERVLTETVRQTATLPAARGPVAVGPMLARGRMALEGSIATAHTTTRSAPGADDATDQQTIHTHASARVSYAPSGTTELGLALEAADGRWSTPSAPDSAAVQDGASYLGASVQVRQRVVGGDDLHLGVQGELGVGRVSMTRQIHTTAAVRYHASSFSFGGDGPPTTPPPVTTDGEAFTDAAAVFFPRVGLFVSGSPLPSLHLTGGVLSQLQPYAARRETFSSTAPCAYGGATLRDESDCGGATPSPAARDAWGISYALFATPFFSVAWDVGPVTVFGQFHVNIAEPHGVSAAAPFGGTFGARFVL